VIRKVSNKIIHAYNILYEYALSVGGKA